MPLSPEEVRTLLAADRGALIGGQALALWSLLYKVAPPEVLESAVRVASNGLLDQPYRQPRTTVEAER